MQIGPFLLAWWHILLILVGLAVLAWFLVGLFTRVTGTWERVDEDARNQERISLVQFGPFVRGRRLMRGGFQEFTGILQGRSMTMTRRDHGRPMLADQGFPETIAAEIDGSITAAMRLTLSADGQVLHGTFTPQKIEFTHNPPKITSRRFLEPSFRRYRLVSRTPDESELPAPPPEPSVEKRTLRKTV